jgi:hypothetical protein
MRKDSRAKVQNGAELLWKSGKVKQDYRVRSTDYGVRGEQATSGHDSVAPLPAGGARERQLGWHAVPTLPRYN